MSHDEFAPASPPPPGPPPAAHYPADPGARRALALPIVAAIAAVALVLGGLIGWIIGYAVHSDGPDFRQGPGMWQRHHGGPGRQFRGPRGGTGTPPAQSPAQSPTPPPSPSPRS